MRVVGVIMSLISIVLGISQLLEDQNRNIRYEQYSQLFADTEARKIKSAFAGDWVGKVKIDSVLYNVELHFPNTQTGARTLRSTATDSCVFRQKFYYDNHVSAFDAQDKYLRLIFRSSKITNYNCTVDSQSAALQAYFKKSMQLDYTVNRKYSTATLRGFNRPK